MQTRSCFDTITRGGNAAIINKNGFCIVTTVMNLSKSVQTEICLAVLKKNGEPQSVPILDCASTPNELKMTFFAILKQIMGGEVGHLEGSAAASTSTTTAAAGSCGWHHWITIVVFFTCDGCLVLNLFP